MKTIEYYKNQKVLVLGLAKSGVSAAKVLHQLGALVTVNDYKPFSENPEAQELLDMGIKVVSGGHPVELLDENFVLVVKNPGIPYNNPMLQRAAEKRIPIITEVELAYQIAECLIIGITGTNGKTTTTTMIALLLNQNRNSGKAHLAGNIGYPASSVAKKATAKDDIVMELSSFQLLGTKMFHPHIAVITNIYEAHIDYHGSRKEYVKAKWRIQEQMTADDYLVINWEQSELQKLSQYTKAKVIPFSTKAGLKTGAYYADGKLYYKDEYIMDAKELGVPGMHNVENALAAIAVAKIKQVSTKSIVDALKQFTGVPHRTQYVGKVAGRTFYNDSKATNYLATEKAVAGFDPKQLILLAGGLDRGNNFDPLIPWFKELKAIILFGETKEKLAAAAKSAGVKLIRFTENVETAVPIAYELSKPEDIILLSPACASWDQYPNFEIRGNRFMEAIKNLEEDLKDEDFS